jgi:hypothetical protein
MRARTGTTAAVRLRRFLPVFGPLCCRYMLTQNMDDVVCQRPIPLFSKLLSFRFQLVLEPDVRDL